MKHTAAPWNVCEPTSWPSDYDLPAGRLQLSWSVGTRPGSCVAFVGGDSPENIEANARLIAAAPLLLAALETMLETMLDEFAASLNGNKPVGHTVGSMNRALKAIIAAEDAIDAARGATQSEASRV